jgi:hypothetical protein
MKPQPRLALAIASASVTAAATATATIVDTNPSTASRAKFLSLDIVATTADVVSNKPQTLKLQHSDTTNATDFADIAGFVGGTDFTVPNADTSNPNLYKFNVNLQGRKRYIRAQYSPRTTQTVFAVANLHNLDQSPISAVKAGVLALVEG